MGGPVRYEVAIGMSECPDKVDFLILALVHAGYSAYYNDLDNRVCFSATEEDVTEIKKRVSYET